MKIEDILNEKTKDELITIARKIGLKGYSKLSKNSLKEKILENQDKKGFKKALKINNHWPIILKTAPVIIGVFGFWFKQKNSLFFKNQADGNKIEIIENIKNSKQEVLKELKEEQKNNDEYERYLKEQEELNIQLLKNIFGENFQVFGQRNNHLFKDGKTLIGNVYSYTQNNVDYLNVRFDFRDINFESLKNSNFNNINFSFERKNIIKGKAIRAPYIIGDYQLYFMMLNEDWVNPIFVLGLVKDR